MAQVKNFGLRGVNSDVQYGKGGGRISWGEGRFGVYAADGTTAAQLRVPTAPDENSDAASKSYVDSVAAGLDPKASVRAATTGDLGTGFTSNGGPGDTITGVGATLTVDGIALASGDRVLVRAQDPATENGIYVYDGTDNLVRAEDFDGDPGNEVDGGEFTFVEEGNLYADTGWVLSTDEPITFGTTALSFTQFSAAGVIEAGDGLAKTGNTLNVGGSTTIGVATNSVFVNSSATGNQILLSSGTAGQAATFGALPLGDANSVSGQLPLSRGGLGTSAAGYADNSLLVKSGTTYAEVALGAANTVLTSTGTGLTYDLPQTLYRDDGTTAAITVNADNTVSLSAEGTGAGHLVTKGYVDNAVTTSEGGLQTEVDAIETAVGLNGDGTFIAFTGTNYLDATTTITGALTALDTAVDGVRDDLTALTAADVAYVNTTSGLTATDVQAAIDELNTDIGTETTARTDADTALQTELNTTQEGAGLSGTGAYAATTGSNYLDGATSLFNADTLLDTAVGGINTRVTTLEGTATSLQTELNDTQTGAGLQPNGSLGTWTDATYLTATETSLKLGIEKLDDELATLAATVGAVDVEGTTGEITVNSVNGVHTVSIDDTYLGQTSITTLGTVGTGTWQGATIGAVYGGTGKGTTELTAATAGQVLRVNATNNGYDFADLSAGNVSFDDSTATLGAANLQGALEAVDGRVDTLVTSLDNLTAADVAFVPGGTGLAATDVQAAIVEIDGVLDTAIQSDGSVAFGADQSMGGFKLTNLGTPTTGTDATTKDYVDGLIAGGVNYRGTLDAAGSAGDLPVDPNTGDMYRIVGEGDFGGAPDFGGNDLQVGDFIIWNGTAWDRLDSVDVSVSSANTDNITVTGNEDSGYQIDIAAAFVGRVGTLETDLTALDGVVDTTIASVGLTADTGALPAFAGTYTTGAGSVIVAINNLDTETAAQDARLDTLEANTSAANSAEFLVLTATGDLANERVFGVGDGLQVTDAGAGGAYTVDLVISAGSVLTANNGAGTNELDVTGGTANQVLVSNGTRAQWGWAGSVYTDDGAAALTVNNTADANDGTISLTTEGTLAAHLITKGYVDTAVSGVQTQLDNLSQSRIEDADGNTYVDVEATADNNQVQIGAAGTLLGTFAQGAGDNNFVFTNAATEVRIEAAGTGPDVDIRLVPMGDGQVFIGEADQDGTIQADNDRNLNLIGGDSTTGNGGNVTISGGSTTAGGFTQGTVTITGDQITLTTANTVSVPSGYTPAAEFDLVHKGYVDGEITSVNTALDGAEFLLATANADLAAAKVASGGNGITFDAGTGAFSADADGTTIRANGGTGGVQLAVAGGTANQTLTSNGAGADATWGWVDTLYDSDDGASVLTASTTAGGDAQVAASGAGTDIDIILSPKGAGFVTAPSAYDMAAAPAEAFVHKQYVDNAITTGAMGGVRSVTAEFTNTGGLVNLGATITGRVFRVTIHITTPFDTGHTITVGETTDPDQLMLAAEIDETENGANVADVNVNYGSATQLVVDTTTGGAGAGGGYAIIEYASA